jgi:hypothetical protein
MNTAFCSLALLGFLCSAVAHTLSVFGFDVQSVFPMILWILTIGIFPVFWAMLSTLDPTKRIDPNGFFRGPEAWIGLGMVLLTTYVVLNLFYCYYFSSIAVDGSPVVINDSYFLQKKRRLIGEISEARYHLMRADQVRTMSSFWLLFYFVPFISFFRKKKITKALQ